jgi:asparagine synthase (glutamine-hydrolysing)
VPGLVGVATLRGRPALADVEKMAAALQREPRLFEEHARDADGRWAVARVHLGHFQPASQVRPGDPVQVLLHGELQNLEELRALTGDDVAPGACTSAVLASLYRRFGPPFVEKLRGAFCLCLTDDSRETLLLAADAVGSYPVYWSHRAGRLAFTSSVNALLRAQPERGTLDLRAVADYIHFGFVLGDKTLAAGVELLAPGTMLIYRWRQDAVTQTTYRRVSEFFTPATDSPAEHADRLVQSFNQAVNRSLDGDHRFGLALSGGLDSRAILSAVNGSHDRVSTYTLGQSGCADQVIGQRLADVAGTDHRFFELDPSYLNDFLPNLSRMVSLTDGLYLSHGLTEMLALKFVAAGPSTVLLRGHGGELAKASLAWPFHTDARIAAMQSAAEFVPYMLARVNYVTPGIDLQTLCTDESAIEMRDGACRSLEDAIQGAELPPVQLCSYLYLRELHRRFTIPSLELFRSRVEIRLPFLDEDFLHALLGTPAALRDGTAIHRAITRTNNPALLRVRNSNTGAPANAGPIAEKIFDKFNTLFRRLNVPGYRHYHNFSDWMGRMLLTSVETVLLDPKSLRRGLWREQTLRRLIGDTRAGTADHAYLLQVLLLLELWQEQNL